MGHTSLDTVLMDIAWELYHQIFLFIIFYNSISNLTKPIYVAMLEKNFHRFIQIFLEEKV